MTLPELLIVVAIIGLLAITVLPSLATTSEFRRGREAARVVSGYCARVQSQAIGNRDWSGFSLTAINSTSFGVDTIRAVTIPPPYTGAILNARLAVQSSTSQTGIAIFATPESACPIINGTNVAAFPLEISDIDTPAANVNVGDLIRFDGEGLLYEVVSRSIARIDFQLRGNTAHNPAGFTTGNQPWPSASPAAHTFEIFRRPVPSGQLFDLPNNRAIDLFWSGYGPANDPAAQAYTSFNAPGQTVSIVFDGTGRLRLIMRDATRYVARDPVYLLIGRPDRVGKDFAQLSPDDDTVGANWQYADSWWIVIDPAAGTIRSAECRPGVSTVTASQEFVRRQR